MLGEYIGVEVGFWHNKIIPQRFVWNGRRHEVKRIALQFERKDGGKKIMCFSVDTGTMLAELAWDLQTLGWTIRGVGDLYGN